MAKHFYPAVLEHGAKGTFAVWLPDFPACVAAATSQEQAIAKAELVLAQAVDGLAERGGALPQPTRFDDIVIPKGCKFVAFFLIGVELPDPSERVNVYLPKSLIARADKSAADLGMSRSSFFGFAISTMIGKSLGVSMMEFGAPRSKVRQSSEIGSREGAKPRPAKPPRARTARSR
jgi:predicted RNase H-like HicB family nuclease